jgi:hypothetical protein
MSERNLALRSVIDSLRDLTPKGKMKELIKKLTEYAQNDLNVLLIGSHGIGKSSIVKEISDNMKVKFKYYSSSTLDPFADIVGVPAPDKEKGTLKFYRPSDLEDAEFLFFDELNRAHPRVLNAVLEIIQFKSVNGKPLPNLKMVWAAINPPGENYQVEEMDPALVDRFHCYIKMQAELDLEYLSKKMNPDVALVIKTWWDTCLSEAQKKVFTPRRVEYVGIMISKDLSWRDSIPQGHVLPIDELSRRIKKLSMGGNSEIVPSKENILKNIKYFEAEVKKDPRLFSVLSDIVSKFDNEEFLKVIDLAEAFPQDLLTSFLGKKFPIRKADMKKLFDERNVDMTQYPKVRKALGWE